MDQDSDEQNINWLLKHKKGTSLLWIPTKKGASFSSVERTLTLGYQRVCMIAHHCSGVYNIFVLIELDQLLPWLRSLSVVVGQRSPYNAQSEGHGQKNKRLDVFES